MAISTIIPDDRLNRAMLDGIYKAFKDDLTELLRVQAEELIKQTVEELSQRVRLSIESGENHLWNRQDVSLTWCIKNATRKDETAWLIEKQQNGAAIWYGISHWTSDPEHVVRFSREQDAEAAINNWGMTDCTATEHIWCGAE